VNTDGTPLPRLIAYARTSTADQQNPEESLRWQLEAARALTASRADIVDVVHDKDTSRSQPWSQRREASGLLRQLSDPTRGWSGIVVGEPQRAFGDTGQVQNVLAQLNHYSVQLWVPELQGPVDPNSEIHDIILSLFGGLSRAERNRLRIRVRTAMRAMAPEGRYLGGRPPHGYDLVRTGTSHPNPEKARQGIELTRLIPNPDTSQVVKQIFAWRAQGVGFRTIAIRLTDADIPCPSAADRARNSHRSGRAWATSAVRAIVINPKYKGDQAYGRYQKVERLRSVENPSAGNITREIPSSPDDILVFSQLIEPIVTEAEWAMAQPATSASTRGPRPDRTVDSPSETRYALRGVIHCAACGRRMQGNHIKRKSGEARVGYRCVYPNNYPGDRPHPSSLFVAENRIIPVVDEWLSSLSHRKADELLEEMLRNDSAPAEPAEVRRARAMMEEATTKLERYMDAVEKGMDPTLYVERTRTAQRELAAARAILAIQPGDGPLVITRDELNSLIDRLGSVMKLLLRADASERRTIYSELGMRLEYHRCEGREKVTAALGVEFYRVGGGT
jgi:site-specific DNA recombinase